MEFNEIGAQLLQECKPELKKIAEKLFVAGFFPVLRMAVEKSSTKVDDAILAALEPTVKAAVTEFLSKVEF